MRAALLTTPRDHIRKQIEQENPTVRFSYGVSLNEDNIGEYHFIIGNVKPALLRNANNLKLLQLHTAGIEGYQDKAVFANPDTFLCNASGAYGVAIGECLVAMHYCIIKKLHLYRDNMHKHQWKDEGMVTSILDSTVLVLGTGDIGSEYARRVRDMGAKVIGLRRSPGAALPDGFDEVYGIDRLDEFLPIADAVAMCLPGTEKTRNIMSRKRLFSMKKGSILLNIGRGNALDSLALADALNQEHLSGAAIDVTDPEPLPAGHPLWDCKSLLITPHVTGYGHLQHTLDTIPLIGSRNIASILRGEAPARVVNTSEGY